MTKSRVLGLRATPRGLHWAVVEGTQTVPILIAHDTFELPAAFDEPAALTWLRSRIHQLLDQHGVTAGAVRFAEKARSDGTDSAKRRVRIEGVLLEAFGARSLNVVQGALRTISSNLGTNAAKKYIDAGEVRGLDLASLGKEGREAVVAAVSALPREHGQ